MPLAWGNRVSSLFRQRIIEISQDLTIDPSWLMSCIAFESGQSFSASVKNPISGAVGLIQFMPQTAHLLGTTTEELAAMTSEGQLDYVGKYFEPSKGKLKNLGDVYMAILWPAAIGKPDDFILFDRDGSHPIFYNQNRGLDTNGDGKVTKLEAYSRPLAMMHRGLLEQNVWEEPNGQ